MITKPLGSLTRSDIETLITLSVRESKFIDYKLTFPESDDSGRKEFLADISSFANTLGGHIVFGVEEHEGVPTAAPGLPGLNLDTELQKLDNLIQSGVQPRVRYSIKPLEAPGKHPLVVIQVDRGAASPHRVVLKGHDKFYARNSQGKYPMDVTELRSAFLASSSAMDKIRRFRMDRIGAIMTGNGPVAVKLGPPTVVLHCFPFEAFATSTSYEVLGLAKNSIQLVPLTYSAAQHRINFDGFLHYSMESPCGSYVQVFRSGGVEVFDTSVANPKSPTPTENLIMPKRYEPKLRAYLFNCIGVLTETGAREPFVLAMSLMMVKGKQVVGIPMSNDPITEHDLLVPETVIGGTDQVSVDTALKSVFDLIWNAGGYEASPNFDARV